MIVFIINWREICQRGEAGRLHGPFDTSHTPFVHRPEQLATPALFVDIKWWWWTVLLLVLVSVQKVRGDPATASRSPRDPSFRLPAGNQTHGATTETGVDVSEDACQNNNGRHVGVREPSVDTSHIISLEALQSRNIWEKEPRYLQGKVGYLSFSRVTVFPNQLAIIHLHCKVMLLTPELIPLLSIWEEMYRR